MDINLTEKECTDCGTIGWGLDNGLCMDCHTKNLKKTNKN